MPVRVISYKEFEELNKQGNLGFFQFKDIGEQKRQEFTQVYKKETTDLNRSASESMASATDHGRLRKIHLLASVLEIAGTPVIRMEELKKGVIEMMTTAVNVKGLTSPGVSTSSWLVAEANNIDLGEGFDFVTFTPDPVEPVYCLGNVNLNSHNFFQFVVSNLNDGTETVIPHDVFVVFGVQNKATNEIYHVRVSLDELQILEAQKQLDPKVAGMLSIWMQYFQLELENMPPVLPILSSRELQEKISFFNTALVEEKRAEQKVKQQQEETRTRLIEAKTTKLKDTTIPLVTTQLSSLPVVKTSDGLSITLSAAAAANVQDSLLQMISLAAIRGYKFEASIPPEGISYVASRTETNYYIEGMANDSKTGKLFDFRFVVTAQPADQNFSFSFEVQGRAVEIKAQAVLPINMLMPALQRCMATCCIMPDATIYGDSREFAKAGGVVPFFKPENFPALYAAHEERRQLQTVVTSGRTSSSLAVTPALTTSTQMQVPGIGQFSAGSSSGSATVTAGAASGASAEQSVLNSSAVSGDPSLQLQ